MEGHRTAWAGVAGERPAHLPFPCALCNTLTAPSSSPFPIPSTGPATLSIEAEVESSPGSEEVEASSGGEKAEGSLVRAGSNTEGALLTARLATAE